MVLGDDLAGAGVVGAGVAAVARGVDRGAEGGGVAISPVGSIVVLRSDSKPSELGFGTLADRGSIGVPVPVPAGEFRPSAVCGSTLLRLSNPKSTNSRAAKSGPEGGEAVVPSGFRAESPVRFPPKPVPGVRPPLRRLPRSVSLGSTSRLSGSGSDSDSEPGRSQVTRRSIPH